MLPLAVQYSIRMAKKSLPDVKLLYFEQRDLRPNDNDMVSAAVAMLQWGYALIASPTCSTRARSSLTFKCSWTAASCLFAADRRVRRAIARSAFSTIFLMIRLLAAVECSTYCVASVLR